MKAFVLLWLLVPVGVLPVGTAGAGRANPAPVQYLPPVDAPVVDWFRPPAEPWGPGNRGLEYATVPGTPVRAAAAGTVVFAGAVADTRAVTLLHDDGLRTSYSFLASVAVAAGATVTQGATVGQATDRLLFSARAGDVYLDPAVLLAAGPTRLRLVPETAPGSSAGLLALPVSASEFAWAGGGANRGPAPFHRIAHLPT